MTETDEQLALKVWKELDAIVGVSRLYDQELALEYARRLREAWGKQEPVAWIDPELGPVLVNEYTYPFDVCVKNGCTPLYAAPPAAPSQDALDAPIVTVHKDGVQFGKWCWVSHEKITGCEAVLIPTKHKQYYEWFLANLRESDRTDAALAAAEAK